MAALPLDKIVDVQASATVDWSPLGEIYVKKSVHYQLQWQKNLEESIVAIAPYGGLIALLPKVHGTAGGASIVIYSQSGIPISSISWEGGRVIAMGWTSKEDLVCILEEGTMATYTMHGYLLYSRPISRETREHRVLDCKFFHTIEGNSGFAVMTNCYEFFVVADTSRSRDEIRPRKLSPRQPFHTCPTCWNVLTSQYNVIVAIEDKLYILDHHEAILQTVITSKKDTSPIHWAKIAVSMDGKAVALVDKGGYLWGGTPDFKKLRECKHMFSVPNYSCSVSERIQTCETEMDLQSTAKILAIEWGAKDFFVLVMEKLMFVKGFGKHWCKYPGKAGCCLQPEIDGLRIISNTTSEFMHRVTNHSLSVLRIGSMEVGALLNDAFKEYEGDESHKADEYIRFIKKDKDQLPDAVLQCVKAAGEEFDPAMQQSLLKSARFGKGFLGPDVSADVVNAFVEMCHHLRVLNSVRIEEIGIPITLRQYYRLSNGVLTDRLTNRGLYPLALEICKYLRVSPLEGEVKILRQWAMRKVQDRNLQDKAVADIIIKKLKATSIAVPFAEIAQSAKDDGRKELAALLLDHEVHAREQVPLLIEMRKADLALDKAIESGDPQLVYRVLDELKYNQYHSQMDRFLQLFHHRPVAAALYKKLCKHTDKAQLLNIYRQESESKEAGCHLLSRSYIEKDPGESDKCMNLAIKEFREGQHMFEFRVSEELMKLRKDQEELESKVKLRVIGLSLFDTVLQCIKSRHVKVAEQLRKEFKMSESQYWWAKVNGLSAIGDYEELERFSRQRRSPIGYEPFADACIQHGKRKEAAKYIPKCSVEDRIRLYTEIDDLVQAADIAFQEKKFEVLKGLLTKAGGRKEVKEHITSLMERLGIQ